MIDTSVYRIPNDDEVRAALSRLGNLQLRRAFYSKLENPHWVSALYEQGAFRNPPTTKVMPDGTVRSDPWPEIDYLVRMAPVVSADVMNVLERIADSTNQWVRRGIMEAATTLGPHEAARLVSKAKKWPEEQLANFRVDPKNITQTIVNLLSGGEHPSGLKLAEAYYCPSAPAEKAQFGISEPEAGIESYWYSKSLPAVAKALGGSRLKTLVRWLKESLVVSGSSVGGEDTSYIWRSLIRSPEEHVTHEISNALVNAVRAGLADSVKDSTKELDSLLKDSLPLLRRIALDVLAEAIENINNKSVEHLPKLTKQEKEIQSAAALVLADESFIDSIYRGEYLPFIRACLSWRAAIDAAPFFDLIRSGPLSLRDERRKHYALEGDTVEETEARMEDYKKHWQHKMLTLIDTESLPNDLHEVLRAFNTEYGQLEVGDRVISVRTFTGSTGPLDKDSISAMKDEELIQHLRNWHPDPEKWMGPTHEGQARVLGEVLAMQPKRFSKQIGDLKTLRPTYIRAVISGWKAAVEAGNNMQWKEMLPLLEWISSLSNEAKMDSEGDEFDDDSDYRNLKSETIRLLDVGLTVRSEDGERGLGEVVADRVMAILAKCAEHPEPTVDFEATYGGDNMDPLTLSLNTVRPTAIRALIKLVDRFPKTTAASEALKVLDKHIADRDSSLAVASAIGEGSGRLYNSAHTWLEERVGLIFGAKIPTTGCQQVTLSTFLATHNAHIALIEMLRGPLMIAIEEMQNTKLIAGWRTYDRTFPQLIGDWIVMVFIGGKLSYDDDITQAWFAGADVNLRGEVLGHLGWQIMKWEYVPTDVLDRTAELWDLRIAHVNHHPEDAKELAGIYWLARSDKYEVTWWLPRLKYASSVIPRFKSHGMIGERLAAASRVDLATTLQVIENILTDVGSDNTLTEYDLIEHAVPQIIAAAFDSDEFKLQKKATELMNKLGAAGHIELRDKVDKLRKPRK